MPIISWCNFSISCLSIRLFVLNVVACWISCTRWTSSVLYLCFRLLLLQSLHIFRFLMNSNIFFETEHWVHVLSPVRSLLFWYWSFFLLLSQVLQIFLSFIKRFTSFVVEHFEHVLVIELTIIGLVSVISIIWRHIFKFLNIINLHTRGFQPFKSPCSDPGGECCPSRHCMVSCHQRSCGMYLLAS